MEVVAGIDALPAGMRFVVTVGVFDGLHRGHAALLERLRSLARRVDAATVVVTFEPHPETVLRGTTPPLLCDPGERLALLERAGVHAVVIQPFDRAFAAQSAESFLERLARGRDLAGVVMSPESAFGRDREGTLERVRALGEEHGFEVDECPSLDLAGGRVSSSRIRGLIEAGRLASARRLLGRRYRICGEVVHGDARGRTLGYPTANLAFDAPVTLPPNGIYAVRATWQGADGATWDRDGVASLGVRPTFGGGERLLEVHLFDFDGDLYGKRLCVDLVRRQRGERRFGSVEMLVQQMDRDAARARRILATA